MRGLETTGTKRHEWPVVVVVLVAQVHTARSHTAPRPGVRKLRGGGMRALLWNPWMSWLVVDPKYEEVKDTVTVSSGY